MRNRSSLFSAAILTGSIFMLAEDTGGGDGGAGDGEKPADDGTAHTDPVPLDPCPFCGGTDLNEGEEQIVCNTCSAMGPVAGSGMDERGAWNKRADDEEEAMEDPMPGDAPPTDPAAHAAGIKTLADARKEIVTLATKAGRVHAGFRQASAAAKKAKAEAALLAESNALAIRGKATAEAALAAEKNAFAEHKAGEPKRLNAAAQRILAASGHPAVEGEIGNPVNGDKGNVMAKADFDKLSPTAKMAHYRKGGTVE